MKQQLKKRGSALLALGRKYLPSLLLFLLATAAHAAEGADEISDVWADEIRPIINIILGIAIVLGVVWFAIMLVMGKKTAMQIGGYILLGALVLRVLPTIVEKISGLDFGTVIGLNS
ncbi:MAG: hypothetical protein LBK47_06690 [Prevotellaceae bacterium]|jgi:hypothetical protein|nr:hypothetical protein [Prevotellaceae bacterium]